MCLRGDCEDMKLSTETVEELVKLRAEILTLTKKEEKLTKTLKSKMAKKKLEEFGPTDSPFKLVRLVYDRSNVSWKDQWKRLAKKLKLKYKEEIVKLQKKYKTEVESLTIEPNEKFKGGK